MIKIGILTAFAALFLGVNYLAKFMLSLLVILFCGYATYELVTQFNRSAANVRAAL